MALSAHCLSSSSFTTTPPLSPSLDSKLGTPRSHSYTFQKIWALNPTFRTIGFPDHHPVLGSLHSAKSAFAVSSSQSSTCVQTDSNPQLLVDNLLSLVEGSDRGALLGDEEMAKVAETIVKLEQYCIPEPLQSPLIFGEWDLVFSSNQNATGGYYRSAIGRTLLKTKQMMQPVTAPDFVGNFVSFSLLGLLPGEVSLKGKLKPLDSRWIEVAFDSPNLKLGPFEFKYGKTSSVKVAIIYVDERIRIGRGSGGSLLVFKRR